jgi:hypothetical protein
MKIYKYSILQNKFIIFPLFYLIYNLHSSYYLRHGNNNSTNIRYCVNSTDLYLLALQDNNRHDLDTSFLP